MEKNIQFRYQGANADIVLHEKYLTEFVSVWKTAKKSGLKLPELDDPDYKSLDTLMLHVFKWAKWYPEWICTNLEVEVPNILPLPSEDLIESEVDSYLAHIIDTWNMPLQDLPLARFMDPLFTAQWGVDYCIDAMLEHAVMHPIRHRFQLEQWMK